MAAASPKRAVAVVVLFDCGSEPISCREVIVLRTRCLVVIAALALAATACGGNGGTAESTTTTTPTPAVAPTSSTPSASGQVKVTVAPWSLAAPIANEVLVGDASGFTMLGGLDATKLSTNAIVRVEATTATSKPAGSLAEAVHDSAGVRLGNNILVLGGGGPSESGTADSQLVTTGGRTSVVGRMPQPRSDQVAAFVGGKAYVLGGYDGANIVGDVVATTDGTSFTKVATLPVPVRYPAIAVLGTSILLFGGVAKTSGTDTAAVQRLDTTTGAVAVIGQLPTTLSHASAVVLGNEVYLLGGYVNSVDLSDQVLRFDPKTNTSTLVGHLPEPNSDAAAVVVDGRGYLVGGKARRATRSARCSSSRFPDSPGRNYPARSVTTARPRYCAPSSSSKMSPSSESAPTRETWLFTRPSATRSTSSRMSCTVPTAE